MEEINIGLAIKFMASNSYPLFPYRQPVLLWRQLLVI